MLFFRMTMNRRTQTTAPGIHNISLQPLSRRASLRLPRKPRSLRCDILGWSNPCRYNPLLKSTGHAHRQDLSRLCGSDRRHT
jgi:hypothetical protein